MQLQHGHRLHYLDEGEGEGAPILMLHGNPTWSFLYRNLVLSLRQEARCLVPDHLGCGLSDKPDHLDFPYDLASHVENLREFLDQLDVDKVRLVLHDWGGAIGFGAFRDQPERVESIVLLNTAAFRSNLCPWRIKICRIPWIGALLVRGFNGFAGPAIHMAVTKPLSRAARQGFLFPYDSWANRVAVWRFVRDIPLSSSHSSMALLTDIEDKLKHFQNHSVTACWGGKDFCFNHEYLRKWNNIFPEMDANLYSEAGHYVLEDAGKEAIQAIGDALRNVET
ncbi:MAG: alpha/beta hydrolase [Opitutae bacterium]|nr:alpha/beta hydrolase [Opitutae bacterium]